MKKLKKIVSTFCLMAIIIVISIQPVSAKTHEIESQRLKMELPEDIIVLTNDLSTTDPLWAEAGIKDVKRQLEKNKEKGIVATLLKKETSTYLNILAGTSKESLEIYNLSDLSYEEIDDYIKGLEDLKSEGITMESSKYEHTQVPFYRVETTAMGGGVTIKKVVYGTIANGTTYAFDIDHEETTKDDEEFLKQVVDSISFTEITSKPKVPVVKSADKKVNPIVWIVLPVLLIVLLLAVRLHSVKKRNARNKTL